MTQILKTAADLQNWVKGNIQQEQQELLVRVDEISAEAVDVFQQVIATTESSIVRGKDNRIDTGLMFESVDYTEVSPRGKNKWGTSIGWTDTREDYFLTQEHGGYATDLRVGSKKIRPMHALHAVWIYIQDRVHAIPGVK